MRRIPRLPCELCGLPRPPANERFCSMRCKNAQLSGAGHPCWSGGRHIGNGGYAVIKAPESPHAASNGYALEHIVVAEKALGHPLPEAAIVHHHDTTRSNNANTNLVICEDQAYHLLLHVRMRVLAVGGDPNTQAYCKGCSSLKPLGDFGTITTRKIGRTNKCRQYMRADERERYVPRQRAAHYNMKRNA